jgi:flagellar basal body-associated protein FliL
MAEDSSKEQPVVEKKSRKRLLGVLVTLVLITGAGVAGTVLGPRLLGMDNEEAEPEGSASAAPEGESESDVEGKLPTSLSFQPLIVDCRDRQGQPHHMKVGVSVELQDGFGKDEFERLQPRGREAAIGYLRGKPFEELTDPAQFGAITKELGEAITKAMGKKHVSRIVITDFVIQ